MKRTALTLMLVFLGFLAIQAQMQERLGDKLFELGEYQKALAQYVQCLEENPENASVMGRMGDCYIQLNQPELARGWFERAIESGHSDGSIHLRFGHCLKFLGQYEEAIDQYEAYRGLDPETAEHFIRSAEYAMKNELSEQERPVIRNLAINSSQPDFGPSLFGDRLIYSSYRGHQGSTGVVQVSNSPTRTSQSHLFVIDQSDDSDTWGGPTYLQSDVERMSNVGPVRYNTEQNMVAFTKNNFRRGVRQVDEKNKDLAIYLAETDERGSWSRAKAFPHNGMGYSTTTPCFSPSGRTLYFASNMEGGEGGYDIYYSRWTGSEWTSPVNAGKPINTPGNEWISMVKARELYFSSDWHAGFGGMDIFRCHWDGSTASGLTNLGMGVNSSRDDYGYILDPGSKAAYFTSNRLSGQGQEDIFRHTPEKEDVSNKQNENLSETASDPEPPIHSLATLDIDPLDHEQSLDLLPDWRHRTNGEKKIEEIYSIQIAVFQDKETEVQRFVKDLSDIGEVYKLYFDRVIKIRVGNYSGRSDAENALNKVQLRGYRDAFIVKEQIVHKAEKETATQLEGKADKYYKVRLAAYSNPDWFNPSEVDHLGLISTREKDGYTIVYLGDYPTIEEAEETRVRVMDAGYTSARLVRVREGSYSIIR